MSNKFNIYFLVFSFLIPIIIGLFLRFEDLTFWEKNKDKFYLKDGRPILTSVDGYYFARYGNEYLKGSYKADETDPLRFVPDNILKLEDDNYDIKVKYPDPIPLESWLAANLSKVFNQPIENIALWLTPILAVLVVIPLVLIFRNIFDLYLTGFLGALTTVVSFAYLSRTSIARFDTDSLNLFFPFAIVLFFLKILEEKKEKAKYIYSIIAGIFLYLYYWWYDHPDLVVLLLIIYVVVLLISKFNNLSKSDFISLALIVLFTNPLVIIKGLIPLTKRIISFSVYAPSSDYPYPSVISSISELQKYDFFRLAELTIGNEILFLLGIFGTILFFVKFWRKALLLVPLFLIGLMAFKDGYRFTMYLAPFIGIGLGFILDLLLEFIREGKRNLIRVFLIPLLTILILFVNLESIIHKTKPKIPRPLAEEFILLKDLTPKDSWIWTWWDFGYPIQFFSERGTYFDGSTQGTPKLYYVAKSFITNSPEEAYNIIMSISSVGVEKLEYLREKKKEPVDKIVSDVKNGKFIKDLKNSVYLLFTEDQFGKLYWIYYFGSWDFKKKTGKHRRIKFLSGCKNETLTVLSCLNGLVKLDLKNGLIVAKKINLHSKKVEGTKVIKIKFIASKVGNDYRIINKNDKGLVFELVSNKNGRTFFLLMDEETFNSMFNQMFVLRNYDKKYFELVRDNFPTAVLYRVKNIKEVNSK